MLLQACVKSYLAGEHYQQKVVAHELGQDVGLHLPLCSQAFIELWDLSKLPEVYPKNPHKEAFPRPREEP